MPELGGLSCFDPINFIHEPLLKNINLDLKANDKLKKTWEYITDELPEYINQSDGKMEERQPSGYAVMDKLLKALDSFPGIKRHDYQIMFHESFINASIPKIFEREWSTGHLSICKKLNIIEPKQDVIIQCPRRFGKSVAVAMYAAAYFYAVPDASIGIYSVGKRTATMLMSLCYKFIELLGGVKGKVLINNVENFSIAVSIMDKRSLSCYPGTHKVTSKTDSADFKNLRNYSMVYVPFNGNSYYICLSLFIYNVDNLHGYLRNTIINNTCRLIYGKSLVDVLAIIHERNCNKDSMEKLLLDLRMETLKDVQSKHQLSRETKTAKIIEVILRESRHSICNDYINVSILNFLVEENTLEYPASYRFVSAVLCSEYNIPVTLFDEKSFRSSLFFIPEKRKKYLKQPILLVGNSTIDDLSASNSKDKPNLNDDISRTTFKKETIDFNNWDSELEFSLFIRFGNHCEWLIHNDNLNFFKDLDSSFTMKSISFFDDTILEKNDGKQHHEEQENKISLMVDTILGKNKMLNKTNRKRRFIKKKPIEDGHNIVSKINGKNKKRNRTLRKVTPDINNKKRNKRTAIMDETRLIHFLNFLDFDKCILDLSTGDILMMIITDEKTKSRASYAPFQKINLDNVHKGLTTLSTNKEMLDYKQKMRKEEKNDIKNKRTVVFKKKGGESSTDSDSCVDTDEVSRLCLSEHDIGHIRRYKSDSNDIIHMDLLMKEESGSIDMLDNNQHENNVSTYDIYSSPKIYYEVSTIETAHSEECIDSTSDNELNNYKDIFNDIPNDETNNKNKKNEIINTRDIKKTSCIDLDDNHAKSKQTDIITCSAFIANVGGSLFFENELVCCNDSLIVSFFHNRKMMGEKTLYYFLLSDLVEGLPIEKVAFTCMDNIYPCFLLSKGDLARKTENFSKNKKITEKNSYILKNNTDNDKDKIKVYLLIFGRHDEDFLYRIKMEILKLYKS